ncbi:MAG: flagellar biosynthesis protein FlhF [Spirochaetota bacterium]
MEYFVEQAPSHVDAERKVREKYGEKARIMHHKSIRMGGFLGLFAKEGVEVTGYISSTAARPEPAKKSTDFEEEKKKILGTVKNEQSIDLVLQELKEIKERMGEQEHNSASTAVSDDASMHPSLRALKEKLALNDFTSEYIEKIMARARSTFSVDELDDEQLVENRALEWIGETIGIHRLSRRERPQLCVLVGPTGVGKTTTIAKLSAAHAFNGSQPRKVRILTIDNYRIGAKEQIETYGNIMEIPVAAVDSYKEMKKQLALSQEADLVFVDTIGKSPREFTRLAEMNELLRAADGNDHIHLAVSATTKTADLKEILRQFEPFGYTSVIVTKVDETNRLGNVISVLHEKQKPISYLTDGQNVPEDIRPATVEQLLLTLEGFQVDRQMIEDKFGEVQRTEK